MIQRRDLDDELLAFIRRVARNLSRGDSHLAEDLEQETVLTALSQRPTDPRFMEQWLRKIAWNRLFTYRAREARSRGMKESIATDGTVLAQAGADPAVKTAREELRRELRGRVRALPEIYRRAVTLRVLDGLPPREVAKELGLPVETVRTRVRRGLQLLRADIGTEDRWASLRTAWAAIPFLRNKKLLLAFGLVSATGVAVATQLLEPPSPLAGAHDRAAAIQASPDRGVLLAQAPASREVVSGTGPGLDVVLSSPSPRPAESAKPDERAFAVRVVDTAGAPAPGADIFVRRGLGLGDAQLLGHTGPDGELHIRVPIRGCWLAARGEPGHLSDSVYLDQPRWDAPDADSTLPIRLELKEFDVAWIQVLGADPGSNDLSVQLWPADFRKQIELRPDSGLFGLSSWVPAWAKEGGRYGLVWGDFSKSIVVARDKAPAWWGRVNQGDAAPPETVDIRDAWEVSGRVLTSDGSPVEGYPVFVPFNTEPGGRRHGQSTVTGPGGRFQVGGITGGLAQVTVGQSMQLRAARPDVGTGRRAVDLGDIDLGSLHVDQRTRVWTTGFEGPVEVGAIHLDEARLWSGYRLAYPECKLIQTRGDLASNGWVQVPEAAGNLSSIVVSGTDPHSGETVRMFRTRNQPDSLPAEIRIDGPLPSPGYVTLENPVPGRAGRLLLLERRSGFRRSVEIPGGEAAGERPPVRVPVSPGLWNLVFQSPDGPVLARRAVQIESGSTVDLGVFTAAEGELQFDWSELERHGRMGDLVTVCLWRGNEPVSKEIVERGRLAGHWIKRVTASGSYRIVATRANETYSGFARVKDRSQATLVLKKDVIVLDLQVMGGSKGPGVPAGTMEFWSASGELIERQAIEANLRSRALRVLAPNPPEMTVVWKAGGRRFEGTLNLKRRQGHGSLTLR